MTDQENADPAVEEKDDNAPKPRLAPKLGLQGSISFLIGLRQRARMSDGKDAGLALLYVEPIDLERLEDIADELEKLRLGRSMDAQKAKRFS